MYWFVNILNALCGLFILVSSVFSGSIYFSVFSGSIYFSGISIFFCLFLNILFGLMSYDCDDKTDITPASVFLPPVVGPVVANSLFFALKEIYHFIDCVCLTGLPLFFSYFYFSDIIGWFSFYIAKS